MFGRKMKKTAILPGLIIIHQVVYYALALLAFGVGMGAFTDGSAGGRSKMIISIMAAWNLPQVLITHYTDSKMENRDMWTELPMYISATTPIGIMWSAIISTMIFLIYRNLKHKPNNAAHPTATCVTPRAWSLRSRHPSRRQSPAGDLGSLQKIPDSTLMIG